MNVTQLAASRVESEQLQLDDASSLRGCVLVPESDAVDPAAALRALSAYTLVGRSASCDVRLERRHVSATHACLRWTGGGWLLQDLGSTNGTYWNGQRLQPAQPTPLQARDTVCFGGNPRYLVESVRRPPVAAVALDGSAAQLEELGLIVLPSREHPEAMFFELESGWIIETRHGREVASDGEVFVVDGRAWRFHCPIGAPRTEVRGTASDIASRRILTVADLELTFHVSPDEEHVQVAITQHRDKVLLGNRACFYQLLTLARARISDKQAHVADLLSGWIDVSALCAQLRTTEQQINVDIFRLRRLFAELGLSDAANIVERQRPGKVRIGTGHLSVQRG